MLAPNEVGLDLPEPRGPGQDIQTCSILRTKVDTARKCVLQLRRKIQKRKTELRKLRMRVHEKTKALSEVLNNLIILELTNNDQMLQIKLLYQAAGAARDECGLADDELEILELKLNLEESVLEQAEIKFYNEFKREHFNAYTQSASQHYLALYSWKTFSLRKGDARVPVQGSMPLDDRQTKSLVDVHHEDDRGKSLSSRISGTNRPWLPSLSALLLVFISIPLILPPTVAAAEIPNTTIAAISGATNTDADSLKDIFIRKGISLLVILWEAALFFIVAGLCFLAYKLTLVKGGRLWSAALMFILMTVSCFIREVQDVSTGVLLGLAVGSTGFAYHTYITGIKQLKHGYQVLEHGVIYLIFGGLFGVAILFFGWPYLESTTTQHWDVYTLPSIVLAFTIFEVIAIMIELVTNIGDDSPGHGQPHQHGVNRGQTLPTPISYPARVFQWHTRV